MNDKQEVRVGDVWRNGGFDKKDGFHRKILELSGMRAVYSYVSIGNLHGNDVKISHIQENWTLIERDGKPFKEEVPLLEKIEKKYSDYDVKLLKYNKLSFLCLEDQNGDLDYIHTSCQSMKGFYKYVYQGEDGNFHAESSPTCAETIDASRIFCNFKSIQPVAVLFYKEKIKGEE